MPLGHASPESTQNDPFAGGEVDRFSLPLIRSRWVRFSLSYTVFLAMAVLVGVVINVSRQPGNADLPKVAGFATFAWLSGWIVQVLTYGAVAWGSGYRMRAFTVGVLGIETISKRWDARVAFLTGVAASMSLVLLGCFYRLVDGGFQVPSIELPSIEVPTDPVWELSSIGLGEVDSVWRTASWLCFVQAIGQMFPLPRTLGRQMLAASVSCFGGKLGVVGQAKVLRLLIDCFAFGTLGFAIWLMNTGNEVAGVGWPLLMCVSVLLWVSSRRSDTSQILEGLDAGTRDQAGRERRTVWQTLVSRGRRWREVRRVRHAHRVEHGEAVDAQRVDEILNQLHQHGIESLNTADRQLLEKVSANLRKQRVSESDH
jgi:hypothetical protein